MKICRVLFLDGLWREFFPHILGDMGEIRLEVVSSLVLEEADAYKVEEQECEVVKNLTGGGAVDMVIVGNNNGAGVKRAGAIAEGMKEMTIIVWNDYEKGLEAPYHSMGFKHFGSRSDLKKLIAEMLGVT